MTSGSVTSATERRELLKEVYEQARGCVACQLHQTRTQVVFGAGNADADLMFIGEAPGADEDRLGLPFVGRAGKLLDKLLDEIGLERSDVFIANTLKCRPPSNRDPYPNEIETCSGYLHQQVALIAAEGDLHAGELLDQAAASGLDRDLTAARARRGPHDRDQGGPAAAALPPRGGVVHAVEPADAARRFRPHPRAAGPRSAATARARADPSSRSSPTRSRRESRPQAEPEPDPEPELKPDPGDAQLGLF